MKKIGIVLAAAAMFDLGTVVVSSQAAEGDRFLKVEIPASNRTAGDGAFTDHKTGKVETIFKFYKIDKANTPQACMAKGGEVARNNAGQQACKSDKPIAGGIEISSFSWGSAGAR